MALVCLHRGVFTRAQFCFYFDPNDRKRALRFVRALVHAGAAVEHPLPGLGKRAQLCRISNRQIYRALGAENIRHRRRAAPSLTFQRLLSLDYILERPGLPSLPTEQEKVACFESLGLERRLLPSRVYRGAVGRQRCYFALKLPIAVDSRNAIFAYADPGHDTDSELRSWGAAHQRALVRFEAPRTCRPCSFAHSGFFHCQSF